VLQCVLQCVLQSALQFVLHIAKDIGKNPRQYFQVTEYRECAAVCYRVLPGAARCCKVLQNAARCCRVLQSGAVLTLLTVVRNIVKGKRRLWFQIGEHDAQ